MSKILAILGLGLMLLHAHALAENRVAAWHYSDLANAWIEGNVTKIEADGSFTVHGADSPYARDFASFHREHLALPQGGRDSRLPELMSGYGDRLKYRGPEGQHQKDYSFTAGNAGNVAIFEEPQYGRDPGSWNIRAEPRAFGFGNLRNGDRVAVGFDSFEFTPYAVYLVNPIRPDEIDIGAREENRR